MFNYHVFIRKYSYEFESLQTANTGLPWNKDNNFLRVRVDYWVHQLVVECVPTPVSDNPHVIATCATVCVPTVASLEDDGSTRNLLIVGHFFVRVCTNYIGAYRAITASDSGTSGAWQIQRLPTASFDHLYHRAPAVVRVRRSTSLETGDTQTVHVA